MRYHYSCIGLLLVAWLLMGCADQEGQKGVEVPVNVDFTFSVPILTSQDVTPTRMADPVVQLSADAYRGLEDVIIIPFKTRNTIRIDDVPSQHLSYADWIIYPKSNGQFYYNRKCQFVSGVASVLVYGRGAFTVTEDGEAVSGEKKSYYGSTTAVIPSDLAPEGISFAPTQIRATTEYDEKAEALTAYLTSIANTPGWSTTADSKLKALYYNYIGKKENTVDYRVFAGSSASILGYVDELYKEAGKYASDADLASAIRARIAVQATVTDEGVTGLSEALSGYPANIDLPDGAAAVQWISGEDRFVAQTTTTTIAPITSVTRFAYPAELYYFTNSLISTTSLEVEIRLFVNSIISRTV